MYGDYMGDIGKFLALIGKWGSVNTRWDYVAKGLESVADIKDAASPPKITTDAKIKKENTGTGAETDRSGRQDVEADTTYTIAKDNNTRWAGDDNPNNIYMKNDTMDMRIRYSSERSRGIGGYDSIKYIRYNK